MENLRKYGYPPYKVALIHGGPGAAGEMTSVAKEISSNFGVLEPLQTKKTIDLQLTELKEVLEKNIDSPIVLVGYSWGAWLAFIFTAKNPSFVKKLILVSSGPFEAKYAEKIMPTRLSRLSEKEKTELNSLMENLNTKKGKEKDDVFKKAGEIIGKADLYNPISDKEDMEVQSDIYESIWPAADKLRKTGELLSYAKDINIPVVAIHGDYDPHPSEGVEKPLSQTLENFKFILLPKCGHTPWQEKEARENFFKVLWEEIKV